MHSIAKKKIYFGSGRPTYLSVVPVQVGACRQWPKIYLCNEQRGPAGQARSFHTRIFLFPRLNIDQEKIIFNIMTKTPLSFKTPKSLCLSHFPITSTLHT